MLEKVVELGSVSDPVGRSTVFSIAALSTGEYVLAPAFVGPQIALYGADGAFISMFDAEGPGPNELSRFANAVTVAPGDTIIALVGSKLMFFDPALQPTRTLTLEMRPRNLISLTGGRIAGNYPIVKSPGMAATIQVVDSAGTVARSMDVVSLRSRTDVVGRRIIATSATGGIWSGRVNEPRLDLFSDSGTHVRTVHVDQPWFTRWSGVSAIESSSKPPRPAQYAVREIDSEHLLLVTRVANENWEARPETPARPTDPQNDVYDTILSLVDAQTGKVLVSRRSSEWLVAVHSSRNLFASSREVASGDIHVVIWRVRVIGQ